MLSLILLASFTLPQPVQEPKPNERKPSLTGIIRYHKDFQSTILGNKRHLTVYLPPEYEKDARRRYPVVYMHDGQNVFDGMTSFIPNQEWRADEAAEALITAGLIEPLIIVGIDNAQAERANEYLPTRAKAGNSEYGGKADLYGKMISDEIMPMIDKEYRTKKGPQNTGLIGSSFGGIVTLHLGLSRPTVFGKLGVVSPSLWWDGRLFLRRTVDLPKKLPLKIWLDMGTGEGGHFEARAVSRALETKGWKPGVDLVYYEDGGAQHNEAAWARRIGLILQFLFPRR